MSKNKPNTSRGRTIAGALLYILMNVVFMFWGIVVFDSLPGPYHPYMTYIVAMLSFAATGAVWAAAPTVVWGWDR